MKKTYEQLEKENEYLKLQLAKIASIEEYEDLQKKYMVDGYIVDYPGALGCVMAIAEIALESIESGRCQ